MCRIALRDRKDVKNRKLESEIDIDIFNHVLTMSVVNTPAREE